MAAMPHFCGPGLHLEPPINRLHTEAPQLAKHPVFQATGYHLTAGSAAMQSASPLEQFENTV